MKRLAFWTLVVVIVLLAFMTTTSDGLDVEITAFIGAIMLLGSLVMLAFTRVWTERGIGLLYVLLGGAILELGSVILLKRPALIVDWAEPTRDSVRALWLVGGPLMLYGFIRYGWDMWKTRHGQRPDWTGTTERRGEPDNE